jgi:hypothetical protein
MFQQCGSPLLAPVALIEHVLAQHLPQNMTYGWLTCLNATYFIRRVAEHTYEFTPAVYTDSTNPTVLEMLLCK